MSNPLNIQQYMALRCEPLCAELLSNGISFNEIVIELKGSSRKRFSSDVEKVSVAEDNITGIKKWIVEINRDGLYDCLPEGLFHQPINSSVTEVLKDKVDNHRRLREEERNARKFFQPFEQEFMRYATMVEEAERELTLNIFKGNLSKELNSIWEIPENIPTQPAQALARLMPWVYYIKADINATAKVLKVLLNKEINVRQEIKNTNSVNVSSASINDCSLGVDSIAGNHFNEPVLEWIFEVKDIEPEEMFLFTKEQPYNHLMNLFTEIFVPIEVDAIFEYVLKNNSEQNVENILGYGFVL